MEQILARQDGTTAWVRESNTGRILLINKTGSELQVVTIEGVPLIVKPGGTQLLGIHSNDQNNKNPNELFFRSHQDMLIVAERDRVRWLSCDLSEPRCELTAMVPSSVGSVLSATISSNRETLWLGTTLGLAISLKVGSMSTYCSIYQRKSE